MKRYAYGGDVNINPAPPAQAAAVLPQPQASTRPQQPQSPTYPFSTMAAPQQPQAVQASVDSPTSSGMTPPAGLYRKGGKVKATRGDGIAQRGKTKGRMV